MRPGDLALIGNCQFSALVVRTGSVVWCCPPRFDSESAYSTLLDEQDSGRFVIAAADGRVDVQRYFENTNALETRFKCPAAVDPAVWDTLGKHTRGTAPPCRAARSTTRL